MLTPPPAPCSCLEALEPRLAPAGIVAVEVKGGMLTLTGDREGNQVEIYDAGNGQWGIRDVSLELGSTTFRLNGGEKVSEVFVTVTGGVKSNLKGGDDTLSFYELQIDGPVTIKDSGGDDFFEFHQNEIRGVVKLDLGRGDDNVYAHGNRFDSTLNLQGSGFNSVNLESGNYRDINVKFSTGEGIGEFLLSDDDEGSTINVFGDINITSRDSREGYTAIGFGADNFKLTGDVKIRTGSGTTGVAFNTDTNVGNVVITGDVSIQSGARVENYLSLAQDVTIGGELEMKMGRGIGTIETGGFFHATLGSFSIKSSARENLMEFHGILSVQGDVSFNLAGGGENTVRFMPEAQAFIGGDLTYKGGRSSDLLQAQGSEFKVLGELAFSSGQGLGRLAIEPVNGILGHVTYQGGKDVDSVELGSSENLTNNLEMLGKVNLNLGKGSNRAMIYDANIQGDVSIRSATQTSTRDVSTEYLTVTDSLLLGSLDIRMTGSQGGTVVMNNSSFLGAVKVDTGKGDDRVYLDSVEMQTGNRTSTNLFDAPVRILLGTGNDVLKLGSQDSINDVGNVFKSRVHLDGGKGADPALSFFGSSNVFNGGLVEKNFEDMP